MKYILILSFAFLTQVSSLVAENVNQPAPLKISSGWQLRAADDLAQPGEAISQSGFQMQGWYSATVPGTVLTTLVNNGVYPEPLYGENNRPDKIPDSLSRAPYWYRTVFKVPKTYAGKKTWLN